VGAKGDLKVFEGETTFRKAGVLKDMLLQVVTNSSKINKGVPCLYMQP
jgi:hypothetical protein